jgi:hypothetical protein
MVSAAMINTTFLHLTGIGRKNVERLHSIGLKDWNSVLDNPDLLPFSAKMKTKILSELYISAENYESKNLKYFTEKLHPTEKWTILAEYFEEASYFDIETNGEPYGDNITLIVCFHKGRLYKFLNGDNLEAFLDLLDDVKLLVSFNGTSFDVPVVQNYFHIPKIPCAHVDLRWLAYHVGFKGGLKEIEKSIGIKRPADLVGINGMDAILLWMEWKNYRNQKALDLLIHYCCADVLSLQLLAGKILEKHKMSVNYPKADEIWLKLDETF